MKNFKIRPLYCIFALIAAVILFGGILLLSGCEIVLGGNGDGDYRFHFINYDITYDVSTDRTMKVTEEITVVFDGRDSTGFFADIPVNGGEQVRNVNVSERTGAGEIEPVNFSVLIEDNDFITVDIGDYSNKYRQTHTYILTYTYCMTKAQEGENFLYFNAVTPDHDFVIEDVDITINLPVECLRYEYYLGEGGDGKPTQFEETTTKIVFPSTTLPAFTGLTFQIEFEEGVLSTYFDFTPYYFVIAAVVLLLAIILLRVFVFNKNTLTPVVNFEAPDGMDPLMMGKLIDNRVHSDDVTALIFYWADKGFLKINLDKMSDPVLIKIRQLPDSAADYEKVVFAGLFKRGDMVRTSDLKYRFYKTFEQAKAMVNAKTKNLFSSVSMGISILFAILGGLLIGFAPFILGITTVSGSLLYPLGFIAIVPALVVYAFSETVSYNRLKNSGKQNMMYYGLIALAIAVCSLIFALIIPSSLMPLVPKILLCVLGFVNASLTVSLVSRTPEYNRQLNEILGFRNFIQLAEKDRLEKLIGDDPQYYYHILPYAQVLNVSDTWEEKFKDLTVAPPTWATTSYLDTFDFVMLNIAIKNSMQSISTGMVSKPSSSGSGGHGGFGGGFGGGHVGGGHGGTSFRGR